MKKIGAVLLGLLILLVHPSGPCQAEGLGERELDVEVKQSLLFFDTVKGEWVDAWTLPESDPNHPSKPGSAIYVYHAVVSWEGNLKFSYQVGEWEAGGKTYTRSGWDKESTWIKVENRSNAPLDVEFKWGGLGRGVMARTVKDATFTMDTSGGRLADASRSQTGLSLTNTIRVSGTGLAYTNEYQKFDSIVIGIDSAVGKK